MCGERMQNSAAPAAAPPAAPLRQPPPSSKAAATGVGGRRLGVLMKQLQGAGSLQAACARQAAAQTAQQQAQEAAGAERWGLSRAAAAAAAAPRAGISWAGEHPRAAAAAGALVLGAGAAAVHFWRKHRAEAGMARKQEWVLEQHHCCVNRIFEHYTWMQTFERLTDAERDELVEMEGIRRHDLIELAPCEALEGTCVAIEQWLMLVPEAEGRLCGPFTTVHAPDGSGPLSSYIGVPTDRLRIWRTMHFLKEGHDFNGTMQSIVAAEDIRHLDEEDGAGLRLTNCVDVVELRYTRCLMMAVALLRALGVDTGGARALCLGCGAGTIPMLLKTKNPGMEVDVVDIEPTVISLARKWLGYHDEELGIKTYVCDAKEFLEAPGHAYDLIFVDAYENSEVPDHLGGTDERMLDYVRLIRSRLKPTGVVASDLIYYSEPDLETGVGIWQQLFGEQYVHLVSAGENQSVVLSARHDGGARVEVGAEQLHEAAAAVCRDGALRFDLTHLIPQEYRRIPEDPAAERARTASAGAAGSQPAETG
eukprot:TRINITY_DN59972_c0_g1_i1.p1 TRINITY_DN59972_c0_g1~~TRINITY_DN59972_c0_g1_i1.p1  ORF type:complete len:535 (+),score=132.01 TRINITY_DN59972_c0_g1_i1:51-1655(+)